MPASAGQGKSLWLLLLGLLRHWLLLGLLPAGQLQHLWLVCRGKAGQASEAPHCTE